MVFVLLLPPPQPVPVISKAQNNRASRLNDLLRLAGTLTQNSPISPTPLSAAHTPRPWVEPGRSVPVVASVVVTVSVVPPLPVIELVLKLQRAPAGNPEQELELKSMVPV